jgi:uncharacterized Zn finger protein
MSHQFVRNPQNPTPTAGKPKRSANGIGTAAGLPRFDVAALRDIAGEKVFARGAAYHEDERVEIATLDRTRILARVIGSEIYRCKLVGAGKKFSGECTCRAFSDWGFCKHLVATALAANDLGPGALEQAANRFARIRDHLRAKGVEGLVELVVGLAERDPALLNELELSADMAVADDATLFATFKKAITEATRTGGYVEYSETRTWILGIEVVLDRIAGLIENDRAALVLRLLDHFFVRMDQALGHMDDSDGGGGDVYARAREIHLAACLRVMPDPVSLARDLFAREVDSDCEFFHGASEAYADVLGEAGLAEYRRLASEAWQKIRPLRATAGQVQDDRFGARCALGAILEGFAEREGDVDGAIAIRAKDLSTSYDYLAIAQLCLDHAREPEALKWAEEGLWQFEDNPDERLICFTSGLYRRMGRKEDADRLLWLTFERHPSIELYEQLKAAAGTHRMAADAVRDRALGWLRAQLEKPKGRSSARWLPPTELLVRLTMTEGLFADAWMIVNGHDCVEGLVEQLAEASEDSHPAEALKVYGRGVERRVNLGGQANYEHACRMVERMRALREGLGEAALHDAYLDDLKDRHKAKRNFMKLLR